MNVARCQLPADTAVEPALLANAFFTDAYRVDLRRGDASVVDIFFAVFGHHPFWLKAILLARHRVGAWFGLEGASALAVMRPVRAPAYRVGEDIGPWPIYFLGERELVAGRNNKHLDFRVSVLKQGAGPAAYAIVSTVCRTHNALGRMYLHLVAPLHAWGVQRLLRRAARAGRL
jgi:hypothetical protein